MHCHPIPFLYKAVPTASGAICEACLIILAFTSIPVNIVWRQGIYYWCVILQHTTQLFIAGSHEVQDHDLWKALTLPEGISRVNHWLFVLVIEVKQWGTSPLPDFFFFFNSVLSSEVSGIWWWPSLDLCVPKVRFYLKSLYWKLPFPSKLT